MQIVTVGRPLQCVAMDIVGPFLKQNDITNNIWVVSDYFTKWSEAYPMPNMEA